MIIRQLQQSDWPTIDRLASNEVQEGDHSKHGSEWGQLRRTYRGERVDSVVSFGNEVVAYVALERQIGEADWHAFIVLDWSLQDCSLQDEAFLALEVLIDEQRPTSVWMRELAGDLALLSYVESKGFAVERRYTYDGLEMVNLRKWFEA